MSRTQVLHITPQLSLGGAGRGLISLVRASREIGGFEHAAISLCPPDPSALAEAGAAGLRVFPADSTNSVVASADLVQVHFWNEPAMNRFLHQALPDLRLLLWAHVRGTSPPQVLTRSVVGLATHIAVTDPATLRLPVLARLSMKGRASLIPAGADPDRLSGLRRRRSGRVRVGYLGSLDFAKLHGEFIRWSSAIKAPVRIVVGGVGPDRKALEHEVTRLGMESRFQFLGFVADIRDFFSRIDILGHAVSRDSYATAETVVMEAMLSGVPPVVLRGAGGSFLVRHRRTGLVANDGPSYVRAIEELARDPELRRRLGQAAREWAERRFTSHECALRFHHLYEQVVAGPKKPHAGSPPAASGAGAFVESLGPFARPFRESLAAGPRSAAADRRIARSSPGLASASSGGIVHYRLSYPEDPHLSLWAGLVLEHQGRFALAAAEYARAGRRIAGDRATGYLSRLLRQAGSGPARVSRNS